MIGLFRKRPAAAQPRRRDVVDGVPIADLKRPLRESILADRKARVTAALRRAVARGTISPIAPRAAVVANVRRTANTKGEHQ